MVHYLRRFPDDRDDFALRWSSEASLGYGDQRCRHRIGRPEPSGSEVRYKAGLDPYLNVIAAQTAVNFRAQQMVASVQLIKAVGGGWDACVLNTPGAAR